jgi:hypothetical protein
MDKHGAPLQPTSPARARQLLKAGRARVHHHTPFVIRLVDRTVADSAVRGVEVGVDPGSRHTGIAVFTQPQPGTRHGVFAIQVEHRGGKIRNQLVKRAALRRGRRSRNLRYRALRGALTHTGLPVEVATGGRTKWNRCRTGAPKSHTLDALHVGELDTVMSWPRRVLLATATGRGSYSRPRSDKYGFPRLHLPRTKRVHGYATGDLVRAVIPTGRYQGTHTGRIAVRSTGRCTITTRHGLVQGIHHRHIRLVQRGDGWAYTTQPETPSGTADAAPNTSPAHAGDPFPPRPESRGTHGGLQ